jgi:hypothetical protein
LEKGAFRRQKNEESIFLLLVPKVTTRSLYPECIANLKLPIDVFYRESRSGVNIAKRNITTGLFGLVDWMKSSQNIQRLGHTKFTSCSSDFVLKTLERATDLNMLISFPFSVIFDERSVTLSE